VRIRGISGDPDSDKVPGIVTIVPLPAGASLGVAGLIGVAGLRLRR
jgi:hypothetical protein